MTAPATERCPACAQPGAEVFYRLMGLPVHATAVSRTPEQARGQVRGDQVLAVCHGCGFVFNTRFSPDVLDYAGEHAESQAFSPTFRAFAAELAQGWVERYDLAGESVIEVGCGGRGDFLGVLVEAGVARAHGVDPALAVELLAGRPGLSGERAVFAPSARSRSAAAVVCRHTLEHVPDVQGFLTGIADGVDAQVCRALLFELPDFGRVLDDGAFWDLHYEHCSNFTASALRSLFERTGLDVVSLRRVYGEQYLIIEADPRRGRAAERGHHVLAREPVPDLVERCRAFARAADERDAQWRSWFEAERAAGRDAVVWGGGSKGSVFLSALGDVGVQRVVDINPGLQGGYLPGSGVPIVAPEQLREAPPASVVLMSPVYAVEVRRMLDELGLGRVALVTT